MARQVLPIVGAVVGGFVTGWSPQGMQWGWMIGSVVGNAVDPLQVKGPSIGDIAQQTSQEGVPRPIVFAVSPPLAGNIVACSKPRIVKSKHQQGKGGGPVTTTESVFRSYAIGVCEGPITAFLRVWRNGSLVYDIRSDSTLPAGQNAKFLQTARFFLGGFDQFPSPDIEAAIPSGTNVPAMRGTAYMVMANEDLTDLRGAVPQYAFQVMRCEGELLTSRPYAINFEDSFAAEEAFPESGILHKTFDSLSVLDSFASNQPVPQDGVIRKLRKDYVIPEDSFASNQPVPQDGVIKKLRKDYTIPVDSFASNQPVPQDGVIKRIRIDYIIPEDSFAVSQPIPSSGTLS